MIKSTWSLRHFFASSLLIVAGCGPQAINDAEFSADNVHEASLNKDTKDAPLPQAGGACSAGQCKIPQETSRTTIQLPDEVEVQPTRIINTGEKRVRTEYVDYHVTRHVWQPIQIRHTILEHQNLLQRFYLDTSVFN